MLALHQGERLIFHLVIGELLGLRPAQEAITPPLAKAGVNLSTSTLPHPVGQHDARGAAGTVSAAAAGWPEVAEIEGLQLLAAKSQWHQLSLGPDLGLGIPLALPDGAVVGQEGVGGAVGVVDDLDATSVGHDFY